MKYNISSPDNLSQDGPSTLDVVSIPLELYGHVSPQATERVDLDTLISLFKLEPFEPLSARTPFRTAVSPGALLAYFRSQRSEVRTKAARWLGLHHRPWVQSAWATCVRELPGGSMDESGLLAIAGDKVYVPRCVWIAESQPHSLLSWRQMGAVLSRFRVGLLDAPVAVNAVLGYLRNSLLDNPEALLLGSLVDANRLLADAATVSALLGVLDWYRQKDTSGFRSFAIDQAEIWAAFFEAHKKMTALLREAERTNSAVRPADYLGSNRALRDHLNILAEAYAVVSRYEQFWNVDKNLAPFQLQNDFRELSRLMTDLQARTRAKTAAFRDYYQQHWGLPMLKQAVFQAFDLPTDGPVFEGVQTNQQRLIVFVVDGLGYTQYKWWRLAAPGQTGRSFGNNLFNLLENRSEFCDANVIASNFSSDTGSGLAALFTGVLPSANGILATQMYLRDRCAPENNLRVLNDPRPVLLPSTRSWIDLLPNDIVIKAFHGAGRRRNTFSEMLYGKAVFEGLGNPERAASRVLKAVTTAGGSRSLTIVYNPLIDRTGHDVGSFSPFEQNELQRLNTMLLSLLVDLLHEFPEAYDGRSTLLVTADHGMYESTEKFITKEQILRAAGKSSGYLHLQARAVWIYSTDTASAVDSVCSLVDAAGMTYEVHHRGEPLIKNLLGDGAHVPDAMIVLTGDGCFVPFPTRRSDILLYGVHGGRSPEEVFVTLISLCLTRDLAEELASLYSWR